MKYEKIMSRKNKDVSFDKITAGLQRAFEKLLEQEKQRDGYIVIGGKDGKPVKVRARDWK